LEVLMTNIWATSISGIYRSFPPDGAVDPWTPADLPADQTLFWYLNSYEDTAVFTANGTPEPTITDVSGTDRATAWDDLSGSEYNCGSGGANAPEPVVISGKNVPRFVGRSQFMPCSHFRPAVRYYYACALVWVYENQVGAAQGIFGASTSSCRLALNIASNRAGFTRGASAILGVNEPPSGVYNGGVGRPVLVSGYNTETLNVIGCSAIDDGVEWSSVSGASAANETGAFFNGSSSWRVGTLVSSGLQDAAIMSIIAMESDTAVVDGDTKDRVEGYLTHKAGVASILPAAHPYKAAPPTLGYNRLESGVFVPAPNMLAYQAAA
jgi:hypothetical protein